MLVYVGIVQNGNINEFISPQLSSQAACSQQINDLDADENKCLPLHLATLMCLAMWPRSGVITWNWYWISGSRWQVIKRPLSRAELQSIKA